MRKQVEWRDIEGFEGLYKVSDKGNAKSLDREVWDSRGYFKKLKGKNLTNVLMKIGYLSVTLTKEGKQYKRYVHRLVCETFLEKEEHHECVNHINGDKLDNRVENLEWTTYSENNKHAYETNLKSNRGENQSRHKLKEEDVLEIRRLYAKGDYTHRGLAKDFGVTHGTIGNIIRRKIWTHI